MSRGTAYYDLPNGERIELPTTMPDVEEVPGPLCDGKFELPEAVKEMFKWMDETFGTWESDFSSFKIWMKLRKNFNPPVRWEAVQDKRRNQSLWAETPIYIKQGRSRAWQEVHIPEYPCTRENKRALKNSASTHSR